MRRNALFWRLIEQIETRSGRLKNGPEPAGSRLDGVEFGAEFVLAQASWVVVIY
jgi:hypothetical protein